MHIANNNHNNYQNKHACVVHNCTVIARRVDTEFEAKYTETTHIKFVELDDRDIAEYHSS